MIISRLLRHYFLSAVILCIGVLSTTAQAATAVISSNDDYLAISVEAEDFESSAIDASNDDDRWVLTDPTTPQTEQDPDANNSDGAVGQMYLELLPDIRVTSEDPFSPPIAIWGAPGSGPTLKYEVDFPEAGRYYLHVRLNSSGSEDNGLHAGLNGAWPNSGKRVQACAARQGWVWTSRQRGITEETHCGFDYGLWLDIPAAGVNTVTFSAREDGFEFDRFALIKDKSNNTRRCRPINETEFTCANGALEENDDYTDVAVVLEVDRTAGVEEDLFVFNAMISNQDELNTATQVILETNLDLTDTWEFVSASDVCTVSGQLIQCSAGNLEPTGADEALNIEFTLRSLIEGNHTVDVGITTTSADDVVANDTSSVDVSVLPLIHYATIVSRVSRNVLNPTVADYIQMTTALVNTSDNNSENTIVTFLPPAGLLFGNYDSRCDEDTNNQLVCAIGLLEANTTTSVSVSVQTDTPDFYSLNVNIAADNLIDGSFSSNYLFEVFELEEIVEEEIVEEVVPVSDSVEDSDNDLGEERDNSTVDEVGVVTQTSGGGAGFWLVLVAAGFLMRRFSFWLFRLIAV